MKDGQKGFTLVEQIVVFSVVGITLPVLAGFFIQAFLSPVQNSASLAASQDLRTASEWISRDIAAGPMGNNLAIAGGPSLASVTIGSSPGFTGNNSLTITYHTWPASGSTTPDTRSIVYRLEDMDPTDDDIQLVRREDDGTATVVAQHILDAADLVFSGSTQSSAGGAPSGITLSIASRLDGPTGTATRQANFVFSVNRSYEPTPAPAPSAQTWNLAVPAWVTDGSGYWEVITTAATGNISATWQLQSPGTILIWIYSGEPMGRPLGDSTIEQTKVNATVVASNEAVTNLLTASTASPQPAGKYTVYFLNDGSAYVNTISASVTYVSP